MSRQVEQTHGQPPDAKADSLSVVGEGLLAAVSWVGEGRGRMRRATTRTLMTVKKGVGGGREDRFREG